MAVTSQIKPVPIIGEATIQLWQEAGLLKPSVIKPVITTIEKKLVIKQMGQLNENDMSSLQDSLETVLANKGHLY